MAHHRRRSDDSQLSEHALAALFHHDREIVHRHQTANTGTGSVADPVRKWKCATLLEVPTNIGLLGPTGRWTLAGNAGPLALRIFDVEKTPVPIPGGKPPMTNLPTYDPLGGHGLGMVRPKRDCMNLVTGVNHERGVDRSRRPTADNRYFRATTGLTRRGRDQGIAGTGVARRLADIALQPD